VLKPKCDRNSVAIYTPESKLKHPLHLLREMGKDILESRELAWRLLARDIRSSYRQSFLGFMWAFIPPIATAAGLVFAKNVNAINVGETDLPYPAYVMFSMALWQTFSEAIMGPVQSLIQSKAMLARINFPREALILAKIGEVFFNFGIKLILIVALFIWFQIPITWGVILAPVALIHLVLLGIGFGTLLAPLGVLANDISKGLVMLMGVLLLLTPVIYPLPKEGSLKTLVELNPITPLLVTTRELATTGIVTNAGGFWIASGFMLVVLFMGLLFYRLAMPYVVERISA
jgi:lipopolysaccharide transport system permease protein